MSGSRSAEELARVWDFLAEHRVARDGALFAVGGGVESISCVQATANMTYVTDEWLSQNKPEVYWPMLQTAENVAKRYGIAKAAQDEYGVQSQLRAAAARADSRAAASTPSGPASARSSRTRCSASACSLVRPT